MQLTDWINTIPDLIWVSQRTSEFLRFLFCINQFKQAIRSKILKHAKKEKKKPQHIEVNILFTYNVEVLAQNMERDDPGHQVIHFTPPD